MHCREYTRGTISDKIDIHEKPYVSRLWFYIFCGLLDAMWQTTAYWFMGAMSNDPAKLANFSGFCAYLRLRVPLGRSLTIYCTHVIPGTSRPDAADKSLQSAGAAGIWRADAVKLP